jgi:hypothetical protein
LVEIRSELVEAVDHPKLAFAAVPSDHFSSFFLLFYPYFAARSAPQPNLSRFSDLRIADYNQQAYG